MLSDHQWASAANSTSRRAMPMSLAMNRSLVAPMALTLAGAGLVAAYLITEPSKQSEWFVVAVPALAALSILIAVAVHRPMRPIPWVLLTLGLGAAAATRAVAARDWYGPEGLVFP